ncbi:BatD family protein [Actomonas aquatica]|uniref:BatD family protein n=1 Tax=Actomonas aquatica TaxID=2866162 RepID=A0ABZ1CB63_9BACT|nr:BatD family protein [Opitutus sp. WL0086]WRQ88791.1 BatD family protein [Opitutus sp. WL0086]
MRNRLLLLFLALACTLGLSAQTVRWQQPDYFAIGQVSNLVLLLNNCEIEGDLTIPQVPNLEIGQPQRGEQSSTRIINGARTDQVLVYYAFPVRPLDQGPVQIPTFTLQTNAGPQTVPGLSVPVREATLGDTNILISDITASTLEVGDGSPIWAGQVVPITYSLGVSARFNANLASEPSWEPSPLIVESWTDPTGRAEGSGRDARKLVTYPSRGYFPAPGSYTVNSVQQSVNIGIPSSGFFNSLRGETFAITSDAPQVTVQPLPAPAPASFAGAVGSFTLTSQIVPEDAAVGDPITWTLALEGTGNWPVISALPARQASNTFRVVQPEATRSNPEGKLFDGSISEDVILIPTTAGTFTLPAVEWTYFDPTSGTYQTLTTEAHELTISPAATTSTPATNPTAANGTTPPAVNGPLPLDATAPIRSAPAPDSPSALPLEPLPAAPIAALPLARRDLAVAGIALAALLPLLWLVLAYRHARAADPGRIARAAKRQLPVAISRVSHAATPTDRSAALLEWQRLTAILWQSPLATPSASLFASDDTWHQLWQEADRALYARDVELPADWTQRAHAAAKQKRGPGFPVFRCLALRHLFPAIALLLTALALTPNHLPAAEPAADPIAAYQSGDFAAAEATWRAAVDAAPTDWVAHHNLALALAQQNRWNEAGAHAAVAFLQNPRDPSTRWHLNYVLDRAGYSPPIIGRFLNPSWTEKIAAQASPPEWQRLLLLAFVIFVAAIAAIIVCAYQPRWRLLRAFAWLMVVLAIGTAAGAGLSLRTYGLTIESDAVLTWRSATLRSIPSDLDEEQQSTPLAPGSLARVQKSFLGWRQLSFPNGQTGWIRAEELVGIWKKK